MHKRLKECRDCTDCDSKQSLFRFLRPEDYELINKDRFVVGFKKGELIYKQGTSFTHVIYLVSGLVKIYMETKSRNLIIRVAKPMEFIGGPGMYTSERHQNSTMAMTNVCACFINISSFKEVVRSNSMFSEELLKLISEKGQQVFERLMSISHKQSPGLVAEALVYFSEGIYQSPTFDLNLTRQEFGDFCGMTKESAIRVLKDFKEEGIVKVEENHFEILDLQALKRISEIG
jgi:CRP/FNR family transcriptional regulator, polysaccharide utilization system transcription regulator